MEAKARRRVEWCLVQEIIQHLTIVGLRNEAIDPLRLEVLLLGLDEIVALPGLPAQLINTAQALLIRLTASAGQHASRLGIDILLLCNKQGIPERLYPLLA
jgi:hypothetical protein